MEQEWQVGVPVRMVASMAVPSSAWMASSSQAPARQFWNGTSPIMRAHVHGAGRAKGVEGLRRQAVGLPGLHLPAHAA